MLKKQKSIILFALCFILMIGSLAVINANSEKDENIGLKTEMLLEHARNDIMISFGLDKTSETREISAAGAKSANYKEIRFDEIGDWGWEIATEFDALDQGPIGSTVPIFLIKEDSSELVVLYKEADGTNVMQSSKKINEKWEREKLEVKGEPILDIDTIEIE
ncbi:hypothetical protein [Clostridium formicaceticum]|uniref:Uncharacterized protein n=1 Tax=Clostridium formicaceticum TaxID=1497 RepID=A0AAC9WF70_9CLOT|nr:hypothetical protein [Clostridium formicaceticum]AOY75999.1 hypothetical protein BJL90_08870 [Clostridium formicaceticum]ARE86354.1 hypothetical protein CLFO_06760 [Clostridium formicaceticum]